MGSFLVKYRFWQKMTIIQKIRFLDKNADRKCYFLSKFVIFSQKAKKMIILDQNS